jgi:hypothetical protein
MTTKDVISIPRQVRSRGRTAEVSSLKWKMPVCLPRRAGIVTFDSRYRVDQISSIAQLRFT